MQGSQNIKTLVGLRSSGNAFAKLKRTIIISTNNIPIAIGVGRGVPSNGEVEGLCCPQHGDRWLDRHVLEGLDGQILAQCTRSLRGEGL